MSATLNPPATPTPAPYIDAPLPYADRDAEIGVIYHYDFHKSTYATVPRTMRITDARPNAAAFTLERNGFALLKHRSAALDLDDEKQQRSIYYPEIERLAKALTGAVKVLPFRPIRREEGSMTPPSRVVHIEYTEIQYHRWAEQFLGPDVAAEYLNRHRWIGLNFWRPLSAIERMPLAVCDAATIRKEDLKPALIHDRAGENAEPRGGYHVVYNPAHRWYYFSAMQPDEMLVMKIGDSGRTDTQWAAHTAFEDPTSRPGAAPCKSFEVRVIAFLPA